MPPLSTHTPSPPRIHGRRRLFELSRNWTSLFTACITLCIAGCFRHGVPAPQGGSDVPPSKVKLTRHVMIAPVKVQDIVYTVNTVGTLEPEQLTSIAAGVPGIVDMVLFKEGKVVDPADADESNSVLVKIDQKKFQKAKELAEANVRRAEANIQRMDAKLELARDMAGRAGRLSERQAISQEEVIRWSQELKVAEAERAAALAELEVARSARELADRDLEKSIVRPPYKGQINQRRVAEGDYVKDETIIATIADVSRLRLATWIPEMAATRVNVGDMIDFELAALPQRKFQAKIFYISTVADPQSHMFECKADIVEPDREMKPGLFARVQIPTDQHRDACVIPEESVRASERGFVAFVPERRPDSQGKPQWVASARRLEVGFRSPGFVEILAGVAQGERVVTRGSEALEDGSLIEFPQEESKSEATAEIEPKKNGKI